MKKIILAVPAAFLLAACSTAVPAPQPVPQPVPLPSVSAPATEMISGQVLGAQAAAAARGGPVTFPALAFDGPVSTVSRDAVLRAGTTRALMTPRGTLTIRYARGAMAESVPRDDGSGTKACVFTRQAAGGSYVVTGGTGAFAGASGGGQYSLVIITETSRTAAGQCSPAGKPVPAGDQADFTASGPLTVNP